MCFHLAAAVGVQLVSQRPLETLLRNINGTEIVLAAAAELGSPLLFTSTSEVYGKNTEALHEDSDRLLGSPFKSRWSYANAKALRRGARPRLLPRAGRADDVSRGCSTRSARVRPARYGMVLPRFVRQALTGDDLTVFGDGTQTRCFIHVDDTVKALFMLADHEEAAARSSTSARAPRRRSSSWPARDRAHGLEGQIALVPYDEAYDEGFEELGRRQARHDAPQRADRLVAATRTLDQAIDDTVAHLRAAGDGTGSGTADRIALTAD